MRKLTDEILNSQKENKENSLHKGKRENERVNESENPSSHGSQSDEFNGVLNKVADKFFKDSANVIVNFVASGGTQLVMLNTDRETMYAILDRLQGRVSVAKHEEENSAGDNDSVSSPSEKEKAAATDDFELDSYQKASLVFLVDSFRSYLMDDFKEEIVQAFYNITKVKNLDSFIDHIMDIYVKYFRNHPTRDDFFRKKRIVCAFIGLVPNSVSKQRPEELEEGQEEAGTEKSEHTGKKRAPREGAGFSESNIRRRLSVCFKMVDWSKYEKKRDEENWHKKASEN
ncbi:hypothetical protein EVA_02958 [gut metagenome]|uniref:Uncharacterized protein n=1 Tax=gut metagenome TaxID=749906 RepID=J9GMX9_9ZZZZ